MTLTYRVHLILGGGYVKPLDAIYPTEAKAESDAFYFLGTETAEGLVIASQVVDSDGSVLNEFEY